MQFDWMVKGEKIREQNNARVADYEALLEQEKEKIEAEEAAEEARAAAEAAAQEAAQNQTETETTTNEIGGEDDNAAVDGVKEALAVLQNGEADETGFQITNEDIDKLSELHPDNEAIAGVQDALRALLEDGKNIDDLDGALQDQVKELLGLNQDKAMIGANASKDQDLLKNINEQIEGGADATELFEQELLKEAQEIYGEAELVSEETAEDGTITKKFKAADGTEFSLVESNIDGRSAVTLNLDDGSSITMTNLEGHPSGLGLTRLSKADEETGEADFTFVNLDVSQKGTSKVTKDEDGNALTINNYTQTEADGTVRDDVTSEFYADGTSTTRYLDENGIGHLSIANKDFTVTESYSSEDNYETATRAKLSVDENAEIQWQSETIAPDMVGPSLIDLDENTAARRDKTLEIAKSGG